VRANRAGRLDHDDDVLVELLEENVQIDYDVIMLGEECWAIHGYIAYDGEVLAATFKSEDEARALLSRLDDLERRGR
jgi:hypothetical protein